MGNGDQQTASDHFDFLQFLLEEVYGKYTDNVSDIIGYNYVTNWAPIVRYHHLPFVVTGTGSIWSSYLF